MNFKTACLILFLAAFLFGFNTNHPYVFLNQMHLDNLKAHLNSGEQDHITHAYTKMKAYGDAHLNDTPVLQSVSTDWYTNYKKGLIDTEKLVAWAVCYNIENDVKYAAKAKAFILRYISLNPSTILSHVSWEIDVLISYDLTVNSGVFAPAEISQFQGFVRGKANGIDWAESDPTWRENMSHWVVGVVSMAALMVEDQSIISRAFAQFKRRIDATGSDGRFPDFDIRKSVGYNIYSFHPLTFAAQTAKHCGKDWWSYSQNGRSLKNSYDFLASPANVQPGDAWIPSIYGNGKSGSHSETTGDYGKTLEPKVLSDQRFMFELALDNFQDPKYEAILSDSSGGKNWRGDIYDYHTQYWLGIFLNAPKKNTGTKSPVFRKTSQDPFNGFTVFDVRGKRLFQIENPQPGFPQTHVTALLKQKAFGPGVYFVGTRSPGQQPVKRVVLF